MTKVVLNNVTTLSSGSAVTTLNNNFDTIETAFDNTLSRDGTSPNSMMSNFDMNSFRIENLVIAISDTEPVRLKEFIDGMDALEAIVQTIASTTQGYLNSVISIYDQFDDRYLGVKSSDPVTDNDGGALVTGTLYFNSVTGFMKVYSGAFWSNVITSVSGLGLGDLAGVVITAAATGDILRFNGTVWVDYPDSNYQPADADLTTIAGLTATTDNFIQSKASAWASRTVAQVKTDLGLTGTNSGDQTITLTGNVTGTGTGSFAATIANDAVTYAKMQNVSVTSRLLGRVTAGAGDVEELTISQAIDFVGSAAQGDILYRNGTVWTRLAAGTSGHFLKTLGAGADPIWAASAGGGASVTISDTAPGTPAAGDLWWNSADGTLYVYYNDGTSSQWVESTPASILSASELLALIMTVDGAGSGLDADLLDGLSSAAFQPIDSDLTSIAALTTTAYGRSFLALADATGARVLSGVVIGTDVQAFDADLTTIAGLVATTDNFIQSKASAWASRTVAQVKTDLGLTGTNSGDQTITLTGDVTGSGVGSFAATIATGVIVNADINATAAIDATKIADGTVTSAEFQFINTLSSNAQTQIDGKQPLDSDLTTIAGLVATTDNFIQSKASAWASRTVAQVKTDLAFVDGPASSTDNALARFNSTTGKLIKNSNVTLNDAGEMILAAGAAAEAPLKFQSGTNLTTAEIGSLEYDGKVFYITPIASGRHVNIGHQLIALTAAYSLVSQTGAQKMFNAPAGGALTLGANTTYRFECMFSLTAMNAASGSFGFALGGTATYTRQKWQAVCADAALATASNSQITDNVAANVALCTASISTTGCAHIKGIIRVGTAGTCIPSVSLTTAAVAIVGVDSFFEIWPVGLDTVQSVGNWA
jgi:nucleoside phosphorylase